jgi:hypothetical protein
MHLISALAAGFVDAPSGSVAIWQHGTTTNATVYSDFDGTTVITSRALDANGRLVVYVDEIVDVVVYDADGATVATFTEASLAQSVAVRNDMFTGSNPDGSTAAGGLTDLDTALSLLHTSLGTTDGKVLISGTATYLKDAITAAQAGVYFNVVSDYGAEGDGVTDDTASFVAAIAAASAAGGGTVIIPQASANYLVSSAITLTNGVSLLGCGPGSYIRAGATTFSRMFVLGGNNVIANLSFGCNPSDAVLDDSAGAIASGVRIVNCLFLNRTGGFGGTALRVSNASRGIVMTGNIVSSMTYGINSTHTALADGVTAVGNVFVDSQVRSCGQFAGNKHYSATTNLTNGQMFRVPLAGSHLAVSGCGFEGSASQAAFFFEANPVYAANTISISGCTYDGVVPITNTCSGLTGTTLAQTNNVRWPDLERTKKDTTSVSGAATNYTFDTTFGIQVIETATSAVTSLSFGAPTTYAHNGQQATLLVRNAGSGSLALTWNSAFRVTSSTAISAGSSQSWGFTFSTHLNKWVMTSTTGNMT